MKDKIVEKFNAIIEKIDAENFYYVLAGVFALILLVDYFMFMGPQIKAFAKLNPEIKTLSGNVLRANNDIKNLNNYRQRIKMFQEKMAEMNNQVKSKEDVPFILERISYLANDNGVKIAQIMPNSTRQELLLEEEGRNYYSLPILIEARSSYHDFGRFLNAIEKDDMSLGTGLFVISSTDNSSRRHSIDLTLKAIVYDEIRK